MDGVATGVVIIGSGFSGLGMAIRLKQAGRHDFVILEKADDLGGTWRDNTYPGCACDIRSHMYSFSFAQNPDWSRSFSEQPEIWRYLRRLADDHGVAEHIRFGVEVTGARWDDDACRWRLRTAGGEEFSGTFLVDGTGALHVPNVPALPGLQDFAGTTFHSSRWKHDYPLDGKRVAVVGTGASAVQFVPKIAPRVARLDVYQRTPPWVLPRPEGEIPQRRKRLFRRFPATLAAYRAALYWLNESFAVGFNGRPGLLQLGERLAKRHIERQIPDPRLRRKVTPDYTLGCKRVLGSNTYYPTLTRDNVELVTTGISRVSASGIVDGDGVEREVDAIIFGTGFKVTEALEHLDVRGSNGRDLATLWRSQGIQTHLGITVAGFPNLFLLLGPNTGLGHNSVVFMIESQIRYVAEAIRLTGLRGAAAIEVRERAQRRFNSQIQRQLARGVWSTGGCRSWYLDSRGVNRTIWPGFTWRYWLRTRRVDPGDFHFHTSGAARVPQPMDTTTTPAT
ncbi:cation diffusion facilitator CzcD-associated flavoprotein CzcO [Saccharomonospora amisosensis]|uniref:Cation diffusion facilitator CzcD-associated flavoprotein CzcO n=1 Tax=Saccharomonospora amisosensis TaxID=1128677 RepID=A0A7X5US81_9PSEU|nr:NAD(P)/FAD-dependent oxidoreductase [Saccharomonospora amisosensis]NIJ13233.1 cation diffusion facilitator CzcD-associated flavoprotein CzcO [Saccharomonospora amisosensis]